MAFDGITVAALKYELSSKLTGGRISKITQPEKNEILLTIKNEGENYRLFISVSASLPIMYLTDENKVSPMTAPPFCMLLRKYIQGAKIEEISQPGLERVLKISLRHLNEMGDECTHILIVELMGKHSNIILTDENDKIIDSIKRISALVSSVREVLPGRTYFIPFSEDKGDALTANEEEFATRLGSISNGVGKSIYMAFTGISPFVAADMCLRAGVDPRKSFEELSEEEKKLLRVAFAETVSEINGNSFTPKIFTENGRPKEFGVTVNQSFSKENSISKNTVSEMLFDFYSLKNKNENMHNKSLELRKRVSSLLEKDVKKYDLMKEQFKKAEDREKYRVYGELITTYGYSLTPNDEVLNTTDFYTGKEVSIPIEKGKTPGENAKKYFDRYAKLKRTSVALGEQMEETAAEIEYLENISTFISIAESEGELNQIKEELSGNGYFKKKTEKIKKAKARPLHYTAMDGKFDIYIGKNNIQNDELTFKFASGNDWWFHAKGVPGSHVVVKCPSANQAEEWDMPDEMFEAAAALAMKYSKNAGLDKAEIDYLRKKNVKKPAKSAPGFVVYYTNYSLVATSDIERFALTLVKS